MSQNDIDFCLGGEAVPKKYHADKQIFTEEEYSVKKVNSDNINRQELGNSWIRSGEFYLFRAENITKYGQIMRGRGLVLETQGAYVNIDEFPDLELAKRITPEEWKWS